MNDSRPPKPKSAAFCNFIDFAAPLTEIMLLGCLAQRAGKKIEWDAESDYPKPNMYSCFPRCASKKDPA